MFGIIGSIFSGIFSVGKTYLKNKGELAKARHEVKLRAIQSEDNWNTLMARGSQTSWKDEYWTVVLSIPAIGAFIPGFVPYITEGFKVLNDMPDWYRYALGVAISAAFAVQKLNTFLMRPKKNS